MSIEGAGSAMGSIYLEVQPSNLDPGRAIFDLDDVGSQIAPLSGPRTLTKVTKVEIVST